MIRFFLSLIFGFAVLFAQAQGAVQTEGVDGVMRSNLKIYVVVAVLTIILLGIFFFLFSIEKRLSKLETHTS